MTFLARRTTVAVISQLLSDQGPARLLVPAQRHLSGTPPRFEESTSSGECGRSVKKPSAAEQKSKILKEKTPIGKLEDQGGVKHPYQEKEPLPEHPGGVNPETGEVGGPRGPEPTRYGDWERKGRVTDF